MIRKILIIFILILLTKFSTTSPIKLTWVDNDPHFQRENEEGYYVKDGNGFPGARFGHSMVSRKNALYIVGGYYEDDKKYNKFDDVWAYNLTLNKWNLTIGFYSNKTKDSKYHVSNAPQPRLAHTAVVYKDELYLLFGVARYGVINTDGNHFNDIWKLNFERVEWKPLSFIYTDDQSGIYDGLDQYPGSRGFQSHVLINNFIYIFGGFGYGKTSKIGYLSDLWKYDIDNNKWVYIYLSGSDVVNQEAKHTNDGNGHPGARASSGMVHINNSIFLFGGEINKDTYRSDLWRYDIGIGTGKWYLVYGDGSTNKPGNYDTMGNGYPGSRCCFSYFPFNNSIYINGGYGSYSTKVGHLGDLWKFENNRWYFLSGSKNADQPPSYVSGNQDQGSRLYQSMVQFNSSLYYFFGGRNSYTKFKNDLWKLNLPLCIYGHSNNTNDVCDKCYKDNIYGKYCNNFCHCKNGTCSNGVKGDGFCLSCNSSKTYGPDCNQTCTCENGNCSDGINGRGTCLNCVVGYYGPNCDNNCTCKHGTCYGGIDGNGTCLNCVEGYFGKYCNNTCTCKNGSCNAGIYGNGTCLNCVEGYFGTDCNNTCTCKNCSEGINGNGCTKCDGLFCSNVVMIYIILGIIISCAIIIINIMIIKYKKSKDKKKRATYHSKLIAFNSFTYYNEINYETKNEKNEDPFFTFDKNIENIEDFKKIFPPINNNFETQNIIGSSKADVYSCIVNGIGIAAAKKINMKKMDDNIFREIAS
jgi:hypothetical protein